MEYVIKQVEIDYCTIEWKNASWRYKIVSLPNQSIFRADLWIYDEYDDYLAVWKNYKASPTFDTAEAAEAYAVKTWVKSTI
ncbi:hypothetical protein [Aureispira anguillae]|uniref:Uncharacterized protein n=1 Tax=Aureispira anguillae TaxID=2864201 RepID=A0A916DSV6_9BACT|nr:hypothetical protein [Aureispira anguillae]BDS11066.1 hypothetical protein AsAng_0017770 [Aureispira anguillae]